MRLSRAPGGLELPHRPLLPPRMSSMSLLTDFTPGTLTTAARTSS
jgi:hypothetical protein